MTIDFSKYIGYILFIVSLIGWAMTYGMQRKEIDILKDDNEDIKEFVKQQVEINAKITYIIDNLAFSVGP